ncbi:MAG: hypothetical protein ACREVS_15570 [Burkholderiales bacterium]
MSALRIGAGMLAALAVVAAPRAEAQVVTGGAGLGYGAYRGAPAVLVPLYPYPHGVYPDPLRFTDGLPSCYRFGRCTLRDLELFRDRPHRLDRLAPAAPEDAPHPGSERPGRAAVVPTPEENIRPEYRGASVPRAEFGASGKPR